MEDATANKSIIVAAVDLGSNTFRLLIARIADGRTSVLLKKNVTVQLGQGLAATGRLTPAGMARGLAALGDFKGEMARYHVDRCCCCGTEALRKAGNAGEFLGQAAQLLGVGVEVLSGDGEAGLSCRGVLTGLGLGATAMLFPLLIVDVGGASTELIYWRDRSAPLLAVSLPAGAAFFTELAGTGGLASAWADFSGKLRGFLGEGAVPTGKVSVVATGGTATALAVLDLGLDRYDEKKVHGHQLTVAGIMRISAELTGLSAAARAVLPGLEEGRGNILPAGLEIYQEILATIAVDGMIISDAGLLEGIMLRCLTQDSVVLP